MRIANDTSDAAVLREIGDRLRSARLRRNLSQQAVANEAGVGRVTVQRMEDGDSPSLASLIRVLRALDLLGEIDGLLPSEETSPVDLVRRRGRPRSRAGRPGNRERREASPGWGDEGPDT